MANKQELVAYMAALIQIMNFHSALGTTINPGVAREFGLSHEELFKILEEENEARKRKVNPLSADDSAKKPEDRSTSGEPDRVPLWESESLPPAGYRPGSSGANG